jgi:hypothetical protein
MNLFIPTCVLEDDMSISLYRCFDDIYRSSLEL